MNLIQALVLLLAINFGPFLTLPYHRFFPKRPLDHHIRFIDGRPLLGPHKTLAGFLAGIFFSGIVGVLLGVSLWVGLGAGFLGMLGDCLSSFIKRRFQKAPGTNMPVVDHIFEAGLPLLFLHAVYSFSWFVILIALILFVGIGWGSTWFRKKIFIPPQTTIPKVVRSNYRFREWRACHTALSPLARLLNFENVLFYRLGVASFFKCLGLYSRGLDNALDVQLKAVNIQSPQLPEPFEGYRILFLSDLHIDGIETLSEKLIQLIKDIEVDLCIFGGDYRMEMYGSFLKANEKLKRLVPHIQSKDGIFGVLGNHDCLEIAPDLEDAGIVMLINDAVTIQRNGDALTVVGLDDPHYYKCQDLEKAFEEVPLDAFKVIAAHSPEIALDIDESVADLCLCGHTHGGQIRLPGIGPVFTHSKAPRSTAAGLWQFNGIQGYTSYGAGSSGVPIRFHCQPEVVVMTLKNGSTR
jgi:uncharacterized protein